MVIKVLVTKITYMADVGILVSKCPVYEFRT